MTFLNKALLWGLLAAVIPVVIHLLNRRRFRTVQWGAMQFLLKAAKESRGKKKLKHFLILACRTLAVAAMIFVIARPLAGKLLGWGSGKPETVLLVLDRSSSMEVRPADGLPTKRQSVLDRVPQALSELGGARLILLDSATGLAQDVPSPEVLPTMSAAAATDSAADIPSLLLSAIDHIGNADLGRTEIWVASDFQENNWKPEDPRWQAIESGLNDLPVSSKVRILALNQEVLDNNLLTLLSVRRVDAELVLDLEIKRADPNASPTAVPLSVTLNNTRTNFSQTVEQQVTRFRHRLPLPDGADAEATGHGAITLSADRNLRDNAVFFTYAPRSKTLTSFVSDEPKGEISRIMQLAAAPSGYAAQVCRIHSLAEAEEVNWFTSASVIWQADFPKEGSAMAESLEAYLEKGGQVLFLPTGKEGGESFLGMTWTEPSQAAKDQFFSVESWERQDGPLRNGISGGAMPLERIRAITTQTVSGGEAISLARWKDGEPLLLRRSLGKGQAFILTTLPDYTWSNIEQTGVHLALVQRLIESGVQRLNSGSYAEAGELGGLDFTSPDHRLTERLDLVDLPNGAKGDLSNGPYQAGVYRLNNGEVIAMNRAEAENESLVIEANRLEKLFGTASYSLFEDETSQSENNFVQDVWRPFAMLLLIALLIEALLCLNPKRSRESAKSTKQAAVKG